MNNIGIIAVVGTIGSGKTTLCKLLASANLWKFLEEDWMSNPYVVGEKAKKSTQLEISLGFLLMRKKQNEKAIKLKNQGEIVLLDTVFEMTELYSKSTLDKVDFKTFKSINDITKQNITSPDIIIYLHGSHPIFIERALKRNWGIKLEKELINKKILKSSDDLIKQYLKSKNKHTILPINTSKLDIRKTKNIKLITQKILKILNRHYKVKL